MNLFYAVVLYCFAEITRNNTPNVPFKMPEECGGDAATMLIALKFIYLGFIEHQQQVATDHLMSLVSVADYLGIESLAAACKTLIGDYLGALTAATATQVHLVLVIMNNRRQKPI